MKSQIANMEQIENMTYFNLIKRNKPQFIHEFIRVISSVDSCTEYRQLEVARNYVNLFLSKWESKMGERFSSFIRAQLEEQIAQRGEQLQQLILY